MSLELLNEFNLGERNPDRGGGICYAMRYPLESLKEQKQRIIDILSKTQIQIKEHGEHLLLDISQVAQKENITLLIEELSVLSDGITYKENFGDDFEGIEGIKKYVSGIYTMISNETKIILYNFVDTSLPVILSEIEEANRQNKILSEEEYDVLKDIWNQRERLLKILNGGVVVFG